MSIPVSSPADNLKMPRRDKAIVITGIGWLLFALPVVLVIRFIGAVIELSGSYNGGTMGSGDSGFVVLLGVVALFMVAAPLFAGIGHYRASFGYRLLAWVTGAPSVLAAGFLYLTMLNGARL